MRLLFATLVLLAHAPEMTDNNPSRELLYRLTHAVTFGSLAVDGFFLLSGYLIVQSWDRRPSPTVFVRNRVLRIVPGYLVAASLSVIVVGWLAPAAPHFFRHLSPRLLGSLLCLGPPVAPEVFPQQPYHMINGALWTIGYEFRCYLLVMALGLLGPRYRRQIYAAALSLCLILWMSPRLQEAIAWHKFYLLTGEPKSIARLTSVYLVGACFYLFRANIRFRPAAAWGSLALLVASIFSPTFFEYVLVSCGGYLLLYFGRLELPQLRWATKFPDISYGVYLYGWPVEALWLWSHPSGSPWVLFIASACLCYGLGWLSWHAVERPALSFKLSSTRSGAEPPDSSMPPPLLNPAT